MEHLVQFIPISIIVLVIALVVWKRRTGKKAGRGKGSGVL